MSTNRFMTILILIALSACSTPDITATSSVDDQTATDTNSYTPTTQSTTTPTRTPAYHLGEPEFSIVIHTKPGDLPPGNYLVYQSVNADGYEGKYTYFYASFDGEASGPLFDLIAPEGGSYSLISYFPNSEDLKQDLRFIYDRRFETDSGFLFINLEDGTIQQLVSGCANGWYDLPDLITPFALFICDDDLYLISAETREIEHIAFSQPNPGRGFVIKWISPDLVWFGSDEWQLIDIDYAYCMLRISSKNLQCYRDLPSFVYKVYPLSQEGPGEELEVYYESMEGDVSGIALFPTDYLENPQMAMSQPDNLPFSSSLEWFRLENKFITIDSNYQQTVAKLWMYDVDNHQATEICNIPERLILGMRRGFWSPDGNYYMHPVEVFTGDYNIQELWQFSVASGEIEQLVPGLYNIRDVIGYFQVP